MDESKKQKVLEILGYWELIEFLEQDNIELHGKRAADFAAEPDADGTSDTASDKQELFHYIGEKPADEDDISEFFKSGTPADELLREDLDKINAIDVKSIIWEDDAALNYNQAGGTECKFFIGKTPRNDIVGYLEKYLPLNERTPEGFSPELPYQDGEAIAWFAFKTDVEGRYVKDSFQLSPIIWALKEWENNRAASNGFSLDMKEYGEDCESFENYIISKANDSGEARVSVFLPSVYKRVFEEYIRKAFPKALEVYRHIGYFKYERCKTAKPEDKSSKKSQKLFGEGFYRKEITNVKKQIERGYFGEGSNYQRAVVDYILSADHKRSGAENVSRVSISPSESPEHSLKLFTDILNIKNAPNGKWPAGFMPALMQQTAVNLAIAGDGKTPIFSVNGPPGTGKTTLLKEVLANNLVERANLIANYAKDDPDSIFAKQSFAYGPLADKGNSYVRSAPNYFKLKNEFDKINDYGMLVASCNNAAVENITIDLPKLDDMLNGVTIRDKAGNDISPEELKEIRNFFNPDIADDDILFTKYSDALLNASRSSDNDDNEKPAENIRSWGLISAPLGKAANLSRYSKAVLKPFLKDYGSEASRAEHLTKYREVRKAFLRQYETVIALKRELEELCEECASNPDSFELPKSFEGKMSVMDARFIADYASNDEERSTKAQLSNPWVTDMFNRERERLFFLACRLHKEFVASSDCMRQNIENILVAWGKADGKTMDSRDRGAAFPALIQSLFLITPVISTTFAAIQSFLFFANRAGIIGTLIVDEAGQASPHVAAGALYRCRKAIIVGDPKQIEPVVTVETDMFKRLITSETLAPYKDKSLSVQGFADFLNPYGTYLGQDSEREWVGCPLVVHRRCTDPMYSISNTISYDGTMKNNQREPDTEKEYILPESCWINVSGSETGGKNHYVPEQGDVVLKLLKAMLTKTGKLQNLYIISPFTTVVNGIKREIQSSGLYDRQEVKTWLNGSNIGTVHTFQGKGTDEVIFLLGCDKTSVSAANWVNKNIVNVAATRAKKRFYIIGDAEVWSGCGPVAAAKEITGCELSLAELNKQLPRGKNSVLLSLPNIAWEDARAVKAQEDKNVLEQLIKCPKCGSEMREYTYKDSGKKFWSCSNFKKCDFKPKCPRCGRSLVIREKTGTKEKFWACTGFARTGCKFTCVDLEKSLE